jgi:hypothetical protein
MTELHRSEKREKNNPTLLNCNDSDVLLGCYAILCKLDEGKQCCDQDGFE